MPRQSGVRLYRELKTSRKLKKIPVIMLSGIAKRTFLRSQKALTEFGGEKRVFGNGNPYENGARGGSS